MAEKVSIMRTSEQANPSNSFLKILVCYHKPYTLPPLDDGVLLPIHVGKAISDLDLHMQADNEVNGQPCDNISDKNPSYNELTAIYWAWKNLKTLYPDTKYIGLFHYRRFLAFNEQKFLMPDIGKPEEAITNYRLNAEKIIRLLESEKIILVKKYELWCTVAAHYCSLHVSDNYRAVKEIISEKFPDYFYAFEDLMERGNKYSARNMFIMKWEDFERYCEWLFAVLLEFENRAHYHNYGTYQMRAPAFTAERLLNVYVHKHKIRAKHFNVYYYDAEPDTRNPLRKFLSFINRMMIVCKCNLAMFILNLSFYKIRRLIKKSPLKH